MMNLYESCLRPLLFRTDPERMHDFAIRVAASMSRLRPLCWGLNHALRFPEPSLTTSVAGLTFDHPIGLAAGFDKNGRAIAFWEALGFSHVEIGSISAHPSAGNPKPRLFRAPQDEAIVVHYGLPNDGAAAIAGRLARRRPGPPLGINLVNTNYGPGAKVADEEELIADYLESARRLAPLSSYLNLNLSCPNTCDGRTFASSPDRLRHLLSALQPVCGTVPVFLKVAPFDREADLDSLVEAASGFTFVSGFSVNLPPGKPASMTTPASRLAAMPGAVAGRPAAAAAERTIANLYRRIDPKRHAIIGTGGVFDATGAWRQIRLGASLVQILTALIYRGPMVVKQIAEGLAEVARRDGFARVQDAVGVDASAADRMGGRFAAQYR